MGETKQFPNGAPVSITAPGVIVLEKYPCIALPGSEEEKLFTELRLPDLIQKVWVRFQLYMCDIELEKAKEARDLEKRREIKKRKTELSRIYIQIYCGPEEHETDVLSEKVKAVGDFLKKLLNNFFDVLFDGEGEDEVLAGIDRLRKEVEGQIQEAESFSPAPKTLQNGTVIKHPNGKVTVFSGCPELVPLAPQRQLPLNTGVLGGFSSITLPPGKEYHVFLSHSWNNHAKVSRVNQMLKMMGLITWLDEERIGADRIKPSLANGLYNSATVAFFISREFERKVNSEKGSDDCFNEFMTCCADEYLVERRIPVVLDRGMLNPKSWKRSFLKQQLGVHLTVDMTRDDEQTFKKQCVELVVRICETIAK